MNVSNTLSENNKRNVLKKTSLLLHAAAKAYKKYLKVTKTCFNLPLPQSLTEILRHAYETIRSLLTFEPLRKLVLKARDGVVAVRRMHRVAERIHANGCYGTSFPNTYSRLLWRFPELFFFFLKPTELMIFCMNRVFHLCPKNHFYRYSVYFKT